MSRQDELDAELSRRLEALRMPPHSESDCFASTRPILLEALIWVLSAFVIWIFAIIFL